MNDHPITSGGTVAFVAADSVIRALDTAAASQGCTRSHLARLIIANHLRGLGLLPVEAPVTKQAARRGTA